MIQTFFVVTICASHTEKAFPVVGEGSLLFFIYPLPKWHDLNNAKLIGDRGRLIVGQDDATVAGQNLWQLSQGSYFTTESGFRLSDRK